jgi:hypothetical protein
MMNKLMTTLLALFLCVSFAYAQDKAPAEKKNPEKRDSARNAMLKERTPEQKKLADCSVQAGNEELKGKEREKFIEKCMAK